MKTLTVGFADLIVLALFCWLFLGVGVQIERRRASKAWEAAIAKCFKSLPEGWE